MHVRFGMHARVPNYHVSRSQRVRYYVRNQTRVEILFKTSSMELWKGRKRDSQLQKQLTMKKFTPRVSNYVGNFSKRRFGRKSTICNSRCGIFFHTQHALHNILGSKEKKCNLLVPQIATSSYISQVLEVLVNDRLVCVVKICDDKCKYEICSWHGHGH
jgi:hypothetical protein